MSIPTDYGGSVFESQCIVQRVLDDWDSGGGEAEGVIDALERDVTNYRSHPHKDMRAASRCQAATLLRALWEAAKERECRRAARKRRAIRR